MDIYEYFNSRDVAEQCKKLGHCFTGREMAYMVWQSNHHTLAQKIAAWEEMMRTVANEELMDGQQLHHFLQNYITRLQQFISEFQADHRAFVYSYEIQYVQNPGRYLNASPLYETYDTCLRAAMADVRKDVISIRISKREIHSRPAKRMGDAMLYLDRNGAPVDTVVGPYYGEVDLLVEPFGFYGWYEEI